VAVLIADQLTKVWAVAALDSGPVHVVGPLRLALAALAVVVVMAITGSGATRPAVAVSLGMLLGGAFGNLADRLFRGSDGFLRGAVVDFVDLGFWPVFNLADSAITCGCFLLLWAGRGADDGRQDTG
jgi:signal peptidase II